MARRVCEYVGVFAVTYMYLEELIVLGKGGLEADGERMSRVVWNCC
jgi:hypothetical protein